MFGKNRTSTVERKSFLTFLQSLQTRAANVVNLLSPCGRHTNPQDPWFHKGPHLEGQCVDVVPTQQLRGGGKSGLDAANAMVANYKVTLERLALANSQLVALFQESCDFQAFSSATEVATLKEAIFTPMKPWFNPQAPNSNLGVRRSFELEEEDREFEADFALTRDQAVREYTEFTNHNTLELGDFAVDEDVLAGDLEESIVKYNFAINTLAARWRAFSETQKQKKAEWGERKSKVDGERDQARAKAQQRRDIVLKRALKVMQKGSFL
jgi:hypothetical protein